MFVVIHTQEAERQADEAERARVLSGWAEIAALRIEREKQQTACVMAWAWQLAEEMDNG